MNARKHRSSWWQLWLLFPVLGIFAFLDARASLSPAGHRAVEVGIVLVIFGLVSVWLRANRMAMLHEISDYVVWREAGQPAAWSPTAGSGGLPPEPDAIAAGNGNGHKPEWIVPSGWPETDAVYDDRDMER